MPPKPSQITIAGSPRRAAARGHDAGQRRHPGDMMRDLSEQLDRMMQLESLGSAGTAEHERLVDMVEAFASGSCELKAFYRGPSSSPCRAPVWRSADGTQAAW